MTPKQISAYLSSLVRLILYLGSDLIKYQSANQQKLDNIVEKIDAILKEKCHEKQNSVLFDCLEQFEKNSKLFEEMKNEANQQLKLVMEEKVTSFAAIKQIHTDIVKQVTDFFADHLKLVKENNERSDFRKILKEELASFKESLKLVRTDAQTQLLNPLGVAQTAIQQINALQKTLEDVIIDLKSATGVISNQQKQMQLTQSSISDSVDLLKQEQSNIKATQLQLTQGIKEIQTSRQDVNAQTLNNTQTLKSQIEKISDVSEDLVQSSKLLNVASGGILTGVDQLGRQVNQAQRNVAQQLNGINASLGQVQNVVQQVNGINASLGQVQNVVQQVNGINESLGVVQNESKSIKDNIQLLSQEVTSTQQYLSSLRKKREDFNRDVTAASKIVTDGAKKSAQVIEDAQSQITQLETIQNKVSKTVSDVAAEVKEIKLGIVELKEQSQLQKQRNHDLSKTEIDIISKATQPLKELLDKTVKSIEEKQQHVQQKGNIISTSMITSQLDEAHKTYQVYIKKLDDLVVGIRNAIQDSQDFRNTAVQSNINWLDAQSQITQMVANAVYSQNRALQEQYDSQIATLALAVQTAKLNVKALNDDTELANKKLLQIQQLTESGQKQLDKIVAENDRQSAVYEVARKTIADYEKKKIQTKELDDQQKQLVVDIQKCNQDIQSKQFELLDLTQRASIQRQALEDKQKALLQEETKHRDLIQAQELKQTELTKKIEQLNKEAVGATLNLNKAINDLQGAQDTYQELTKSLTQLNLDINTKMAYFKTLNKQINDFDVQLAKKLVQLDSVKATIDRQLQYKKEVEQITDEYRIKLQELQRGTTNNQQQQNQKDSKTNITSIQTETNQHVYDEGVNLKKRLRPEIAEPKYQPTTITDKAITKGKTLKQSQSLQVFSKPQKFSLKEENTDQNIKPPVHNNFVSDTKMADEEGKMPDQQPALFGSGGGSSDDESPLLQSIIRTIDEIAEKTDEYDTHIKIGLGTVAVGASLAIAYKFRKKIKNVLFD